jgi:hypothetical protein
MSGFTQYSGIAAGYAAQYNVPQPIAFGLFDQESNWNPFAVGDNGAAIGFGQLHAGAASDVGVNRFDPVQNIKGSLQYLSQQFNRFGNWTDALGAYNQGAGNYNNSSALNYAKGVLDKAKKYLNGDTIKNIGSGVACFGGDTAACASLAGGVLGGDECGTLDFVCKLRKWIESSSFFKRLALATLALLFVLGGLYLMKGNE